MERMDNRPDADGSASNDDALAERAAKACARARQLISDCVRLQAESQEYLSHHRVAATAIAERRAALESSVGDYTRGLRDGGAAPERIVVLLKTLVDSACPEAQLTDLRVLRDDVVTWGIDAYFAA